MTSQEVKVNVEELGKKIKELNDEIIQKQNFLNELVGAQKYAYDFYQRLLKEEQSKVDENVNTASDKEEVKKVKLAKKE